MEKKLERFKHTVFLKVILLCSIIHIVGVANSQIIVDHSIVSKYDEIPQQWIDSVKKMWLSLAGESHALAYVRGLVALEALDPKYDVSYFFEAPPQLPSDQYLRADLNSWGDLEHSSGWIWGYGEEDWFTSELAINRTKAGIKYCHDNNFNLSAYGFVLCYDGGILDATDYLAATQSYIDYCHASGYNTTIFFATGAVDDLNGQADERGYNKYLLYESIRDYVSADPSRILFDYADILCYDDGSDTPYTVNWNGHIFPVITPTNALPAQAGHIGAAGELRLAKAMWWMLARIAGWDGISDTVVPVTGITVNGAGGANTINIDNGTLQLTANVSPADATDKTITWSVQNGTGQASINASGIITAMTNGTVTAKAIANDGSGVFGTLLITISNQTIHVSDITVTGTGGSSTIITDNGTLQLNAAISPDDALDKTVTWSLQNGTGQASINNTGLITAIANGTVTAKATANDGSGVFGTMLITISNQVNPVTGINISGQGGANTISLNHGTLQLYAEVSPSDATDKTVTWSVQDGTGQASMNTTGILTAIENGTVTVRATANDGSGVIGSITITISNQVIEVTEISVNGTGGINTITTDNGQLQMIASVLPDDATNKSVTWSVQNGTGRASINSTGLLKAFANGTVTVRASSNDSSGVFGTLDIAISNQVIPVEGISVRGENGASIITSENGTLQLFADISPGDASDQSVTWTIQYVTGQASINASGLVTAVSNGTVTAKAQANDGSGISGTLTITISDQIIPVTQITVTGEGGSNAITTEHGKLQLTAEILPSNATDQSVTWSVQNGTGKASISTSGQVTAVSDGSITARATANDGSGISGTLLITISNQVVSVSEITITGEGGLNNISNDDGQLQLYASVLPDDATNKAVTWSVQDVTGHASISSTGLVTAISDGTVTAMASANDGSGISGSLTITISNQAIPVESISIRSENGSGIITPGNGTLQLYADVLPDDATDKSMTWSIQNGSGQASVSPDGLVTAISDGLITVTATANDGSGIYGTITLEILEEEVLVSSIVVYSANLSITIDSINGTIQLLTNIYPANATNKTVIWSVENITGNATINQNGLLKALSFGIVRVRASSTDGSGTSGILNIQIQNQTFITDDKYESVRIITSPSSISILWSESQSYDNIRIFSMDGIQILDQKPLKHFLEISRSLFYPGIYIMVLKSNNLLIIKKFSIN